MGCDGGTIPRRDELVRQKKKPEQKDKNAEAVAKWKHCAITQDPLHKPIVACELGKLYNKESVLEHLLNKDKVASESACHLTKLSDVKALNLTEKPGFAAKTNQKGDEYVDFHDSRYICPVTGLEMNGRQRFYLIWNCGCVVSERAIKEVKSETCHKCGKPFSEMDVIILNGTDEEIEILRNRMVERRRVAKLEKRKKKATTTADNLPEAKKIKTETSAVEVTVETDDGIPGTSGMNNKIKSESGMRSSAPKRPVNGVVNGNVQKERKSAKNIDLPEKAKNAYSIAKDPSASAAYKSLFTTCASAKKQEKAHWVTHNPCFY